MDIKEIMAQVEKERKEKLAQLPILTVGQIIEKLKAIKPTYESYRGGGELEEKVVIFEFANCSPTSLDSWRGVYAELALGFSGEYGAMYPTYSAFLKMFEDAVGKTFSGWKGGDFTMDVDTPVWVDNPGNCGRTAIIDVVDDEYRIKLITAELDA